MSPAKNHARTARKGKGLNGQYRQQVRAPIPLRAPAGYGQLWSFYCPPPHMAPSHAPVGARTRHAVAQNDLTRLPTRGALSEQP
jgi:hypothetical protein